MPMPKSVTKIDKNGITFIDNVDAVQYTLDELTRAALKDVGKLLRREIKKNVPIKTGTLRKNIGTWVRKKEDGLRLEIGVYTNKQAKKKNITPAFHAHLVQFGTGERFNNQGNSVGKMPATPFLDTTTYDNIDKIRLIQGQYLSAIADANRVAGLIDESEEISDDD